jgi:hypothetical protein
MIRSAQLLLAATIFMILSGCSTVSYKPITPESTFWANRDKSIAAVATTIPEPSHAMLGSQGFLDVAINSAGASGIKEKLKTLNTKRVNQIDTNLAQSLETRGFKVKQLEQRIDSDKLVKFTAPKTPELFSQFDFRSYKANGADYVLFINVLQLGTQRSYYGFIPTSAPMASFSVVGQLVDTRDNTLVWYGVEKTAVPIPAPWDQAPEFPNLMETVQKNIEEAATRLERSLFAEKSAPPPVASSSPTATTPQAQPPAIATIK